MEKITIKNSNQKVVIYYCSPWRLLDTRVTNSNSQWQVIIIIKLNLLWIHYTHFVLWSDSTTTTTTTVTANNNSIIGSIIIMTSSSNNRMLKIPKSTAANRSIVIDVIFTWYIYILHKTSQFLVIYCVCIIYTLNRVRMKRPKSNRLDSR